MLKDAKEKEPLDLSPALDMEYCREKTQESRFRCEQNLRELFKKYNVSEEDGFKVASSILEYIENLSLDAYDVALTGGAELGELKGYKAALDEAEEVAVKMSAANIMKMRNGVDV